MQKFPEFIIKSTAPTERLNIPGPIAAPNVLFEHVFSDWDYVVHLTQGLREADLIDDETLTSANDIFDDVYLAMEDLIRIESWEFFHRYCFERDWFSYEGLDELVEEITSGYTYALSLDITWQDVADKIVELVNEAQRNS